MNYRIIYKDELYHHGVKGMKWGVRKDTEVSAARSKYRQAYKQYSKSYDKAYNFSARHPVTQWVKSSKNYKKSNDLWDDVTNKAAEVRAAKSAYKKLKTGKKIAKQQSIKHAKMSYKEAKAKNKSTYKQYSKAYDKAYNFSARHPVTQWIKSSKNYKKSDDLWEDVTNKAGEHRAARDELRKARKSYRDAKRG